MQLLSRTTGTFALIFNIEECINRKRYRFKRIKQVEVVNISHNVELV
jgi:hypothetical protein